MTEKALGDLTQGLCLHGIMPERGLSRPLSVNTILEWLPWLWLLKAAFLFEHYYPQRQKKMSCLVACSPEVPLSALPCVCPGLHGHHWITGPGWLAWVLNQSLARDVESKPQKCKSAVETAKGVGSWETSVDSCEVNTPFIKRRTSPSDKDRSVQTRNQDSEDHGEEERVPVRKLLVCAERLPTHIRGDLLQSRFVTEWKRPGIKRQNPGERTKQMK